MLHAVIMAGGAGTRFWPASRVGLPKQLLALDSDRTMIQATYDRIRGLVKPDDLLIVTNEALVDAVAKQLPELPARGIIGEPCKRDTAPCVGLAAGMIARTDPDATMLVMPSDHVIRTTEQFQSVIRRAVGLLKDDPQRIVTIGIRPSYPAEVYGYIERGTALTESDAYQVRMFREKPDAATAQQYVASGKFYWNSGIFIWRAKTIWDALCRFEPDMGHHLSTIVASHGSPAFPGVLRDSFARIQGKSIDFAVMERYDNVVVIEATFQWDDLGSWRSLARLRGIDSDGNTSVGRHLGINTRNCIVRGGDDQHLIVTLGLDDCIVVHTPDATLVARKQDEESVRQVVELLRQKGWKEYL